MAADIDQNKLKVAIEWIRCLANGINPIDGSALPESDIVNNVHISRCLFFVSGVLDTSAKKKSSPSKQYDLEFMLSPEDAAKVKVSGSTGIALFVKEINRVIPENMKPLTVTKIPQWLISSGYLEEVESSDGHKYKVPTELGASIGITSAWRTNANGQQFLAVSYDYDAQRFILDNLVKGNMG